MITREVQEVCRLCDFHGTLHILISVPDGEALAERTFNPRLGIVGGNLNTGDDRNCGTDEQSGT